MGPKTLRKGLLILDVLHAAGDRGLKIVDIAARSGIHRPTVYRFLEVLLDMGYVCALEQGRLFAINPARFQVDQSRELRIKWLKPVLQNISLACGDSSFLVCRDGTDSLCLHREIGTYPVQVLSVTIGHRQPLGVGAAGLALLASLPQTEIDAVLKANAAALGKYGGMTCDQLRQLIVTTRERGWSVVGNAAVPGVLGVGVPIVHHTGQVEFAISVSSMIDRMPQKRQREIIELIKLEIRNAGLS